MRAGGRRVAGGCAPTLRPDPPGSSGAGADIAVGSHEGEYDQVALGPLRAVDRAHHDALALAGRIEGASHTAHLRPYLPSPHISPYLPTSPHISHSAPAPSRAPSRGSALTLALTLTLTLALTLTLTLTLTLPLTCAE